MRLFLIVPVLFIVTALNAQDSVTYHCFNPVQVSISTGLYSQGRLYATFNEFKSLAQGSELLRNDLTGFNTSDYSINNSTGAYNFLLGFRLKEKNSNKLKANPVFRLGFTYLQQMSLYKEYHRKETFAYDTLVSSQTGQEYYVDSVSDQNYYLENLSDVLALELSTNWSTRPDKRWSFFGGVGISGGLSLNSVTNISYQRRSKLESGNDGDFNISNSGKGFFESKDEMYTNKANSFYAAFFPVGINWRIGKRSEFLRKAHLFMEFRPGVSVRNIPETRTYARTFMHHAIGIKVNWD